MRSPAVFARVGLGLLVGTLVACANRGMEAPDHDGVPVGEGGDDGAGIAGRGGSGGSSHLGGGGAASSGIAGGVAGRGGAVGNGGTVGVAGTGVAGDGGPGMAGGGVAGAPGGRGGTAGTSMGSAGAVGRGGASGLGAAGAAGGGAGAGVTGTAGGAAGQAAAGRGGAPAGAGGSATGGAAVGGGGVAGNGRGGAGVAGTGVAGGGGRGGAGAPVDGGGDGPTCASRFSFEGGALYGARLNTGYQTGFTAVTNGTDAFCGGGALALPTMLDVTNFKGEVIIPFGQAEDVSGKTFSMALKATPAGGPAAFAIVFLIPSYTIVTAYSPLPGAWTTKTVTLPAGPDAGTTMATGIAIQVLGRDDVYAGTISVDEIDLR